MVRKGGPGTIKGDERNLLFQMYGKQYKDRSLHPTRFCCTRNDSPPLQLSIGASMEHENIVLLASHEECSQLNLAIILRTARRHT